MCKPDQLDIGRKLSRDTFFITDQIKMFPGAEELWVMLEKVKKAGYLPYLLLTPDPNGPLSAYMLPPIHTQLEPSHMDQLKTIRDRLNVILDNLVDFIFSGSILAGWTSLMRGFLCGKERVLVNLRG